MTDDDRTDAAAETDEQASARPYNPADKFAWREGDIKISPAKWGRSYDPGDGGRVLVQDLDELVLHLTQAAPRGDLQEELEEFLKAPDAKFMPEKLRAQLIDAGFAVPDAEDQP